MKSLILFCNGWYHPKYVRLCAHAVFLIYSSQTPQKDFFAATDFGMGCLRAIVKLLDRLELRSNTEGDESVNTVSLLFNKYSTALLGSIETGEAELVRSSSSGISSFEQIS
jgi:hypothetical protein